MPAIPAPRRRYLAGRLETTYDPGAALTFDPHTMMVVDENGQGVVTVQMLEHESRVFMPEARAVLEAWYRGDPQGRPASAEA